MTVPGTTALCQPVTWKPGVESVSSPSVTWAEDCRLHSSTAIDPPDSSPERAGWATTFGNRNAARKMGRNVRETGLLTGCLLRIWGAGLLLALRRFVCC